MLHGHGGVLCSHGKRAVNVLGTACLVHGRRPGRVGRGYGRLPVGGKGLEDAHGLLVAPVAGGCGRVWHTPVQGQVVEVDAREVLRVRRGRGVAICLALGLFETCCTVERLVGLEPLVRLRHDRITVRKLAATVAVLRELVCQVAEPRRALFDIGLAGGVEGLGKADERLLSIEKAV